ncbi:exonuclease SbcCD subunit D [Lactobacillus sp. CC-MHH1034]|uniref:exonuclease SbcCD subunit D n=1 Tax=Agrilactobacillus fermenti TaxID=2586909 RepID=UPI001E3FBAF7|nr:exonuclease SbcCD subunit D [Agrilactobacillus fermenti]MCD2255729.1 exonuclease SbcCD subunit D [Agrilactobacillus fermenti]
MRLLHTADWHIGRRLHGFDLTAEQEHAFKQIEAIALEAKVDGVIIAGDLYDRSLPSEQAVALLNDMIQRLNLHDQLPIYAISGNHDSAIRLATGAPWYQATNYYLATELAQAFEPIELTDIQIFLLPYFETFQAQQYFNDPAIKNVAAAMARIVTRMKTKFDADKRQILVAHFFADGSATTDSETQLKVGGLGAIPVNLLQDFDYVALGHLHGKDALHADNARYSGSPVKFSLSEAHQQKGVWLIDTADMSRTFKPLTPINDVVQLTDSFAHLTDPDYYGQLKCDDYLGITLTDTKPIVNVLARLREIYPNIISLERAQGYTTQVAMQTLDLAHKSPLDLLNDFYEHVAKEDLTEQQKQWAAAALKQANEVQQS